FARRTRGKGVLSTLLLAAGLQLFVCAGFLAPAALRSDVPWPEVGGLAGAATVLVALAALGLGTLAVEGSGNPYERRGTVGAVFANGAETLASGVVSLLSCGLRF